MEIHLAQERQLLEVLYIIRECAEQLMEKGVRNWHNSHVDYAEIKHDISKNFVYIMTVKKLPVGTITLKPDNNDNSITYIDRLAIFPYFQRRGYAKSLIDFAIAEASTKCAMKIRGTIPVDDKSLCKLLEDKGFVNLGVAHQIPNEMVKILFEKQLT